MYCAAVLPASVTWGAAVLIEAVISLPFEAPGTVFESVAVVRRINRLSVRTILDRLVEEVATETGNLDWL